LFGKVELPPTPFLSELPDSFAKLDADIGRHSSSVDLVEALHLLDAHSLAENRSNDGFLAPVLRNPPELPEGADDTTAVAGTVRPFRKSYEFFNRGIAARRCGRFKEG
jgi:hypothetical protein